MKEIFQFSFNAVMPILLLSLVGYLLRITRFADDRFFKKLNTLVFRLFLPILLFMNIYSIESLADINWSVILYCAAAILIISTVGYLITTNITKNRQQKGVIVQCFFRSNYAIIGLPLAEALGGSAALSFASVLSAVSIPLFNVLAVVILSHYSHKENEGSFKATLKKTAKNPLIIAVLCGVAVVFLRNVLPFDFTIKEDMPYLYSALSSASKVASPLALVVLGARFDFGKVGVLFKKIAFGTFMRLIFAPVVGLGLGILLSEHTSLINLTQTEYPALISLFATPVAVSSAVMVSEIGGDEQLAGQLVVWTSLLSVLTMFVIIFVMKSFALI